MKTQQIFSRMFIMEKKLKSFLPASVRRVSSMIAVLNAKLQKR